MKLVTHFMVVAALAAAMSGCGRDNYNGKYVGYETQLSSQSSYPIEQRVELNLKHSKGMVSGTITYTDTGQTGEFSAVSEKSNRLDSVEVRLGMSYNQNSGYQTGNYYGGGYGMYSNCMGTFRGSLEAPGDGRRLTGTLNAVNASNSTMSGLSLCQGKNLTVNKQ